MVSKKVSDLLAVKGSQVWSVPADTTVFDALRLMAEKNVGAVLVMQGDKLVGIFSERDYARKVILHGKSSREILVNEIMTPEVAHVSPGQSVHECMELMTHKHIRHLPVLEENVLRGVISIGDVVKAIISDQEFMIGQLESYIAGR